MEGKQDEVSETKIPHLDVEKAIEKARWLKQDLDKSEGWTQRYHVPDEFNSWSKTFPNEDVPVKMLYRFENLPMSAEKYIEMMQPSNLEIRAKWDKTTVLEKLDNLPNGGCIAYSLLHLSSPLSDRDFVLYMSPPHEFDWFGRKAYGIFFLDATHPSRPAGAHGIVRATNGGNFYIAVQDEKEPGNKCEAWQLTANRYNGWIGKKKEWLVAKKATKVFYEIRKSIIEGHKDYFS